MYHLDGAWVDILGWGFVLAGLAAFAAAMGLIERRRRHRRSGAAAMSARLPPGREWELVMRRATRELARGPKVEALQADAMVSIEAAEYAYNRMLQEYARHCAAPSAPSLPIGEPAPAAVVLAEPAPKVVPAEERAPLAA